MNIETLFANTIRDYLKTGYLGVTFTADAAATTITAALDAAPNTSAVRLTTTGTLPAPLALATTYYVRDKAYNVRKLAATSGGAAIALTDDGTGTHTLSAASSIRPLIVASYSTDADGAADRGAATPPPRRDGAGTRSAGPAEPDPEDGESADSDDEDGESADSDDEESPRPPSA
jgi:hypothetical protein